MSRKDYALIADAIHAEIRDAHCVEQVHAIEWVARTLANRLATANDNFKRDRFLIACGCA